MKAKAKTTSMPKYTTTNTIIWFPKDPPLTPYVSLSKDSTPDTSRSTLYPRDDENGKNNNHDDKDDTTEYHRHCHYSFQQETTTVAVTEIFSLLSNITTTNNDNATSESIHTMGEPHKHATTLYQKKKQMSDGNAGTVHINAPETTSSSSLTTTTNNDEA